ncbi:transposase [Pseudomonas mucidolens]|uniref:Transposase n=1 Tax=Pseudomonas mucidolens TaxID=46679 RepID=A0A1H2MQV3_9PSED|nr:transposase [Pseudomonas mucidolens]
MFQIIQACVQPGASIASVALSHHLNANLVHNWIRVQTQNSIALQPLLSGAYAIGGARNCEYQR